MSNRMEESHSKGSSIQIPAAQSQLPVQSTCIGSHDGAIIIYVFWSSSYGLEQSEIKSIHCTVMCMHDHK